MKIKLLLLIGLLTGCGDGGKPEAGPTDEQSIKASQEQQKLAAEGEGASMKK